MKKNLISTLLLSSFIFYGCSNPNTTIPELQTQNETKISSKLKEPPVAPKITLKIKKAEIDISEQDVNNQFNSILAISDEKRIQDTVITVLPNSVLRTTGKLVQKIPLVNDNIKIPFTLEGKMSVQAKNIIKFDITSVKVAGIPVKSLMDILGIELANFAKLKDSLGRIEVSGNSILMILEKFSNETIIDGSLKSIQTSDKTITIIF